MVFVARMLRTTEGLNDFKIVLINDRADLEEQLSKTATLIGGRVNVIESAKQLRAHLSHDSSDISMVMAHKFLLREQSLPVKVAEALGTYQAIPCYRVQRDLFNEVVAGFIQNLAPEIKNLDAQFKSSVNV